MSTPDTIMRCRLINLLLTVLVLAPSFYECDSLISTDLSEIIDHQLHGTEKRDDFANLSISAAWHQYWEARSDVGSEVA